MFGTGSRRVPDQVAATKNSADGVCPNDFRRRVLVDAWNTETNQRSIVRSFIPRAMGMLVIKTRGEDSVGNCAWPPAGQGSGDVVSELFDLRDEVR